MPASPYLGWGKHTSTTAHVSEGSLTGAVGTATTYTWDTCYGTSSTPRLGTCLVTCEQRIEWKVSVQELSFFYNDKMSNDSPYMFRQYDPWPHATTYTYTDWMLTLLFFSWLQRWNNPRAFYFQKGPLFCIPATCTTLFPIIIIWHDSLVKTSVVWWPQNFGS